MYQILIVDDEEIVRLALKSLINWEENGFLPPFEATNGQMALELVKENQHIDLVLTDINMPIMDGLTFIKEVKKIMNPPEIIVLSAYEDYNLVRNAFKLGIEDYIIKAEMEPETVLRTVLNILERSSIRRREEKKYGKYLKQEFLKQMLFDKLEANDETEEMKKKLNIFEKNIVVCSMMVDSYNVISKRYQNADGNELGKYIVELVHVALENEYAYEVVGIDPETTVLVISFHHYKKSGIYQMLEGIFSKIRKRLHDYMNIGVTIGVSSIGYRFLQLNELYEESMNCARYRYLLGKGRNIYPEQLAHIEQVDQHSIISLEEGMVKKILDLDKKGAMNVLHEILKTIGSFRCNQLDEMNGCYMELIYFVIHFMHEQSKEAEDIYEHNTDFLKMLKEFETTAEIEEWIINFFGNLIDYYINAKGESQIILRAKEYVRDFYMKKITLTEVCKVLSLSEGYFSALFTQECGYSFIHYLTEYRVNQAKKLLNGSNMKIYEICEAVGYENVEHFSRVFKKATGCSPLQYRGSHH